MRTFFCCEDTVFSENKNRWKRKKWKFYKVRELASKVREIWWPFFFSQKTLWRPSRSICRYWQAAVPILELSWKHGCCWRRTLARTRDAGESKNRLLDTNPILLPSRFPYQERFDVVRRIFEGQSSIAGGSKTRLTRTQLGHWFY